MYYKISVASSDSENINETFGSEKSFVIYELSDGVCKKSEERICTTEEKGAENNCNSKPLGALDAFTRMNLQDEILEIWQKHSMTMIMVTHVRCQSSFCHSPESRQLSLLPCMK